MPSKSSAERAHEGVSPKVEPYEATAIIALVPMKPHDIIGDIGCGDGRLTIPLARYAYGGRVYAFDSQQKSLDAVEERAKQARVGNIETVLSKESSLPLEDGTLDGVVVSGALNGASKNRGLFKELHRVLKKGGWSAVITATGQPLNGTGAAQSAEDKSVEVLDSALDAGFTKLTARPINPSYRLLVLRK
jgi:arsenite methyltransferase